MNGEPAVLYLRVAPQLRRALRRVAAEAGVSMSAWAVHVLAAAVGPQLYVVDDDGVVGTAGLGGATAIPDDVILAWYRTVYLPRVGQPDRHKFRRSG
jgi:hypothetical protein